MYFIMIICIEGCVVYIKASEQPGGVTHGKFWHAGLSEKTAERGVFLDLNEGSRNPPFRGTFWRKGVP